MYVLLYVSYLYICNVIGANKNKFKKKEKKRKVFSRPCEELIIISTYKIRFHDILIVPNLN